MMARRRGEGIEVGKRRAGEEHHCYFSKNKLTHLSLFESDFLCLKLLVYNQNLFWTEHVKGVCKREPPHLSLLLDPEYRMLVQLAGCSSLLLFNDNYLNVKVESLVPMKY